MAQCHCNDTYKYLYSVVNGIEWTARATRQLLKLDRAAQVRIRNAVDGLRAFPEAQNVARLTGHRYAYRLRTGHYRVIFDFDGQIREITIQEVRKRDEHTY